MVDGSVGNVEQLTLNLLRSITLSMGNKPCTTAAAAVKYLEAAFAAAASNYQAQQLK